MSLLDKLKGLVPVRLLAVMEYPDRSAASKAEYAIKRLTAGEKRALAVV